jgi:hypothetical protein
MISGWILIVRNVADESCRESQKTHFMLGKYGRGRQATYDNIVQCMHFACMVAKATDMHTQNM